VVVARAATASLPLGRQWRGDGAQWAVLDVGARGGTVWLGFIGGERACLHRERNPPAFNSQYGERPRTARACRGEPAADRWTTPSADGDEGEDSTWRGRRLQGPRSAPSLKKQRPREGASGPGRRGGRGACAGMWACWSAGGVAVCQYVSDWQRLTEINSKFFN
jgi:hypothetical protein